MNILYWFLPIIIAQFQAVPFILSAFILFLTPLKGVVETYQDSTAHIYMFWLFYLMFGLPIMVVVSYIYLFILRNRVVERYKWLLLSIYTLLIAAGALTWSLYRGSNMVADFIIVVIILLFYLIPFTISANLINKTLNR